MLNQNEIKILSSLIIDILLFWHLFIVKILFLNFFLHTTGGAVQEKPVGASFTACQVQCQHWWSCILRFRLGSSSSMNHSLSHYYYSFKIFCHFWLAKIPRIIHHSQLLSTKCGRILRYVKNDVKTAANCQIMEPGDEVELFWLWLQNGGTFDSFQE